MRIPAPLHAALVRLNVWAMFVQVAQNAANFEQAKAGVEELKRTAERNYKAQALDAHPDRGGDEEQMKELNAAMDLVAKVDVEPPRPRPTYTVIHVQFSSSYGGGTTTSSTGGFW